MSVDRIASAIIVLGADEAKIGELLADFAQGGKGGVAAAVKRVANAWDVELIRAMSEVETGTAARAMIALATLALAR